MNIKYKYFLIEASELLAELTRGLLDLEKHPEDRAMVKKVLRTLHTFKGAAGVMGLTNISGLAHAMESCLIRFMDQDKVITSEHITLLLEAGTLIEKCLARIRQGKDDKGVKSHEIILKLTGKNDQAPSADKGTFSKTIPKTTSETTPILKKALTKPSGELPAAKKTAEPEPLPPDDSIDSQDETIRIKTHVLDQITKLSNEILINNIRLKNTTEPLVNLVKKWENLAMKSENGHGSSQVSPLRHLHEEIEHSLGSLDKKVSDTAALSREVTDLIKETHMVPIKNQVFMYEKYVRDLSLETGKKIRFETKGSDIHLGRSLLDQIKEPICHLLRNCAIHGLESSEKRLAQGKPEFGTIGLKFVKEMGQISIICHDDGQGLDAGAIRSRSVEKRLVTREAASTISDQDAYYLILTSGYSSVKMVTELAGRGVGLDVVKSCVSGMGGSISIESENQRFCRVILTLPLSIDLISVFGIQIMGQYYLLPFRSVVETRLIKESDIFFETGKPMIKYNQNPVPLVPLSDILDMPATKKQVQHMNTILVRDNFKIIALIVDKFVGKMEIMPRKLDDRLSRISNFRSSTILANGYPAFILDVSGIIKKSKTLIISDLKDDTKHARPDILVADDSMTTSMLIEGMLSSNGYNVTLAKNGVEALKLLSKKNFDLFITDIHMPKMDGFELTDKIRQLQQYRDAPIVILSSLGEDAELRKGVEAGANAYMVKGAFDEEEFLATIGSLIT